MSRSLALGSSHAGKKSIASLLGAAAYFPPPLQSQRICKSNLGYSGRNGGRRGEGGGPRKKGKEKERERTSPPLAAKAKRGAREEEEGDPILREEEEEEEGVIFSSNFPPSTCSKLQRLPPPFPPPPASSLAYLGRHFPSYSPSRLILYEVAFLPIPSNARWVPFLPCSLFPFILGVVGRRRN